MLFTDVACVPVTLWATGSTSFEAAVYTCDHVITLGQFVK